MRLSRPPTQKCESGHDSHRAFAASAEAPAARTSFKPSQEDEMLRLGMYNQTGNGSGRGTSTLPQRFMSPTDMREHISTRCQAQSPLGGTDRVCKRLCPKRSYHLLDDR